LNTLSIDTSQPVMVTGATGYVAGWIIKRLLSAGCTVHATVRDPHNKEKLRHLDQLAAEYAGELRYFQADLLAEESFAAAMDRCGIVFHTASPFVGKSRDPQRELIEPAQRGTQHVLQEVNRNPAVKRVVLTSCCAAIYGDNRDLAAKDSGELTEEDWNTTSTLKHQPHSYAKTLAERRAWEIARAQDRWQLVVVNPSLVLGPAIDPYASSESFALMKRMGDGSLQSGVPDYEIGVVDVRDVADAQLRAAWIPSASGRYIISGHNTDLLGIAKRLHERFGLEFPVPTRAIPTFMVWLFGPLIDKTLTRKFISRNFGYPFSADNSKSIDEFDMRYRTLDETVSDMFQQMVNHGRIEMRR
jgi:dihydroflavonol-4-reductase